MKRSLPLASDLVITRHNVRTMFAAPTPGPSLLNPEVAMLQIACMRRTTPISSRGGWIVQTRTAPRAILLFFLLTGLGMRRHRQSITDKGNNRYRV